MVRKGSIMAPGGELANGTPPGNIHVLLETVSTYGKYE